MQEKTVNKILLETEHGYDLISQKFSETRKHFWRGLEFVKDFSVENDNVLDFGCGNGRLYDLFVDRKINYFGVDVSQKLIEFAQKRHSGQNIKFSKINPSQTSLAFDAGFFNTIYSIAVFHHFPSNQYRKEVAKELYNKTKDGGYIIVTVWYLWQSKYFKNILQNWKRKIQGKTELDWNDCEISFTDNAGKKIQRFHHAFTKRELKKLFESAGFVIERCEVVENRNILMIGKKE